MAKKKINRASEKFLEAYLNNPSLTGFEKRRTKALARLHHAVHRRVHRGHLRDGRKINPEAKYKVVIEAHADEISWFVHYITSDGFIYLRCKVQHHQIAPSKRVDIHTKNGPVKAVYGRPSTPALQARRHP